MGRDKRWAKVVFHNLGLIIFKPICDWICKNPARRSLVPRPHPAFRRLQYGKVIEGLVYFIT